MSTIGVKFHNEDIHNIIHKPMSPTIKSPRYKSKRKYLTRKELSERLKYNGHQTFGLAHYEAPESCNYLKKGQKSQPPPAKPIEKKDSKRPTIFQTSPLPKCNFYSAKQSDKNFVKENIKNVKAIKPKVPCPRRVETPRGTVKDLAHLLQMIKIRQSEKYGRIPKYLCERRKQWAKEEEEKNLEQLAVNKYKEKMGIGTMGMNERVYMIDNETRQKLLDVRHYLARRNRRMGLKENWNELSKQFLKLPVLIDTLPKIKRKEWLEKEIDQLEKDVQLVESHPYIYLERSDTRPYEDIVAEEIKLEKMSIEGEKKQDLEKKESRENDKNEKVGKEEQTTEEKKEEDTDVKILNY